MIRPPDLMPQSCREVLGRRMLIRRWTLRYAATAIAFAAAFVLLHAGNRSLSARRDQMAAQARDNVNRSEIVRNLLAEIADVEDSITRYNRLAWPVRASDVINALAAAMPPETSLTELSLTPREERVPPRHARGAGDARRKADDAPPRTMMVVEAEGVAASDSAVASLMSALDGNLLFSSVNLDFTRARVIDSGEVRSFRITCEVDLSLRYTLGDASAHKPARQVPPAGTPDPETRALAAQPEGEDG